MLRARDIVVRRGGRVVLDHVSMDVRPGVVSAVVGPNGAGKSTLVAALTDLARPTHGEVTLDEAPLHRMPRKDVAKRIAVLQQQFRSTFPFRAHEIVALGRAPYQGRETSTTAAALVEQAMTASDVAHLADRPVNRLSGGERQRVFLARALAQILPLPAEPARYLLLDEPTASLDLRHQTATLSFARAVATAGAGVVCVLHDLNLAARFADEVLVLQDGRAVALGAPDDVLTAPTLTPVYGPRLSVFRDPADGRPVVLAGGPEFDPTSPRP